MISQTLLHTEEMARCAAIYAFITDSLVWSLLETPPEERDAVVMEQVKSMSYTSKGGVAASIATASKI